MNPFSMFVILAQQADPLDQPVVVAVVPSQIITIIIVGVIAGFFASLLIRGRAGVAASIVFGIVGAVVGTILFGLLGIQPTGALAGGITLTYYDLLAAFIGAVIVLLLLIALFGRRFR
jgi:uncharacterized membrane protein YeaQ/YmgE (transglycosylase-associated protein family)